MGALQLSGHSSLDKMDAVDLFHGGDTELQFPVGSLGRCLWRPLHGVSGPEDPWVGALLAYSSGLVPCSGIIGSCLRLLDTAFSGPFKAVHGAYSKTVFSYAITLLQAVNVPNAAVSTLEFFFFIYETC